MGGGNPGEAWRCPGSAVSSGLAGGPRRQSRFPSKAQFGRRRYSPYPCNWILAREIVTRQDVAITEDRDQTLARPQRRLLRRIYNGRIVPIIFDDRPFLT